LKNKGFEKVSAKKSEPISDVGRLMSASVNKGNVVRPDMVSSS
jgi:hypothetical protein